jgi:hypothetical protein
VLEKDRLGEAEALAETSDGTGRMTLLRPVGGEGFEDCGLKRLLHLHA